MSSSKLRGSATAAPVVSPTSSASTSSSTTAASIASRAAEKLVQRQGSQKSLHLSASTSASSLPVASAVSPTSATVAAAVGVSLAAAAQPEHAVSRVQRATSLSKIQTTASATALAKTAQKVGSSIVDDGSNAPKSPALSSTAGGVSVVIAYDSNSSVGSSATAAQTRPSLVAYDSTLLTKAKNARPGAATAGGGVGSSALASYDSTLSTGSIGEPSAEAQPPTPLAKRGSSGSLNKIASFDSAGNGNSSPSLVRSASAPIAAGLAMPNFSSVVQINGGGGDDALPSFGIQSPKLRNLLLKAASTTKRKVVTQVRMRCACSCTQTLRLDCRPLCISPSI